MQPGQHRSRCRAISVLSNSGSPHYSRSLTVLSEAGLNERRVERYKDMSDHVEGPHKWHVHNDDWRALELPLPPLLLLVLPLLLPVA